MAQISKWSLKVKDPQLAIEFDEFLVEITTEIYNRILTCNFLLIIVSIFQFFHLNDSRIIIGFTGL